MLLWSKYFSVTPDFTKIAIRGVFLKNGSSENSVNYIPWNCHLAYNSVIKAFPVEVFPGNLQNFGTPICCHSFEFLHILSGKY